MMQPDQQASIAAQLAALPNTPMKALWVLWDEHFPRRPTHTNRSYIESRIAYRIQELAYGELPAGIRRNLADCGAKHSKIAIAKKGGRGTEFHLMPGTALVREWDERKYRSTLTTAGLNEVDGKPDKSRSAAARHITGTQWSGSKFFGLIDSKGVSR